MMNFMPELWDIYLVRLFVVSVATGNAVRFWFGNSWHQWRCTRARQKRHRRKRNRLGERVMLWNGVPLGFTKDGKPHAWPGSAATLVFGPPGSGKTVKLICNQLLDDDSGKRSYVVIDPKGEVCAITSKFRRKVGDVKIINPYGLLVDRSAGHEKRPMESG